MNKSVLLSVKKLKELRNKKNLSQEGLCDEFYYADIQISLATIKRVELGMKVTYSVAKILSDFYKIPVENLIDLTPSHQPQPKTYKKKRSVFMVQINSSENTTLELMKRNILTFLNSNQFAIIDVKKDYLIGYSLLRNKKSILARVTKFKENFISIDNGQSVSLCIQELEVEMLGSHIEISENDLEDFRSVLAYFDEPKLLVGSKFIQVENSNLFFTQVYFSLGTEADFWEGVTKTKEDVPTFGREHLLTQFSELIENFEKSIAINIIGTNGSGKSHLFDRLIDISKTNLSKNSVCYHHCKLEENLNLHVLITELIYQLLKSCGSASFSKKKRLISRLKSSKQWNEIDPHHLMKLLKSGDLDSYQNFSSIAIVIENLIKLGSVKVLAIDDLHLANKIDIEVLNRALDKPYNKKIIIIYTSSRDMVLPLKFKNLESLEFHLTPLSHLSMQKLASFWFSGDTVFRDSCIENARGNPLYLNQLLCEKAQSRTQLFSPTPLLKMRINALSERQKLMIYYAAIYGIKVPIKILNELLLDGTDLLNFLAHIGLINFIEGNLIEFEDQTIHTGILELIPIETQKFIHKKITGVLINLNITETRSDHIRLSYHFEKLSDIKNAIKHYYQAALVANLESSNELSLIDLRSALVLLGKQPNINQEIKVRELQISLFRIRYGWQSSQVDVIQKILVNLTKKKNISPSFASEFLLWLKSLTSVKLNNALKIAANLYKNSIDNNHCNQLSFVAIGATSFWIGNLSKSIDCLLLVFNNYQQKFYVKDISQFGVDSRAIANLYLVLNFILRNDFVKAERSIDSFSIFANETKNTLSLALLLLSKLFFYYFKGDLSNCIKTSDLLLDCAKKSSFAFFTGSAKMFSGWAIAKQGDCKKGADLIIDGYENWIENSGCKLGHSLYCCQLAEILILDGQASRSLEIIKKGIRFSYENNETVFLSKMYHLKGLAELKLSLPVFIISNSLGKAKNIAEKQNAILFIKQIEEDNSTISFSNMITEKTKTR